jgi:NAD(P)-dependent dehydrogenase (short-subunit alcohol dehydrogenase family)
MQACLEGKVAVVTGAGGGIGRGIALAMAAAGARVVVNDLGCNPKGEGATETMADAVVEEILREGGMAVADYASVASVEGANALVDHAITTFGRVDILVNNAGITRVNMLWDMTEAEWDAVIGTNLKGTWACTKAVAPHFIAQRNGRIINFSSDMSLRGGTGVSGYSASKAGVLGLTMTTALELGVYGVTANAIWPGARSRFREAGADWRGRYPMVRPPQRRDARKLPDLDPEDVAPIVVYLAREEAQDINGQTFRASAGDLSRVSLIGQTWTAEKDGRWTQDELAKVIPRQLTEALENPAPASDDPVWRWMI